MGCAERQALDCGCCAGGAIDDTLGADGALEIRDPDNASSHRGLHTRTRVNGTPQRGVTHILQSAYRRNHSCAEAQVNRHGVRNMQLITRGTHVREWQARVGHESGNTQATPRTSRSFNHKLPPLPVPTHDRRSATPAADGNDTPSLASRIPFATTTPWESQAHAHTSTHCAVWQGKAAHQRRTTTSQVVMVEAAGASRPRTPLAGRSTRGQPRTSRKVVAAATILRDGGSCTVIAVLRATVWSATS